MEGIKEWDQEQWRPFTVGSMRMCIYTFICSVFPLSLEFQCSPGRCFYRIFSRRQLVLLVCHPEASLAFLPMKR